MKDKTIILRVSDLDKSNWEYEANLDGLSLSQWIRMRCNSVYTKVQDKEENVYTSDYEPQIVEDEY